MDQPHPLAAIGIERFLTEYWQKQPLLVRGAFPDLIDPLSPEELAGLACEPEVGSRLVLERGASHPWEVRYGPLTDSDFSDLPETHWTLLVQDVEKHLPELSWLVEPFRFIPDWRIDDLMISYAVQQGTVGPHIDDYDVFLIQGLGCRDWRISTTPTHEDNFLPELELRVLRDFQAERSWRLQPGDMLYLPPRIAHYGVSVEPSLTYSVGFRAPSVRELLSGFVEYLVERTDKTLRYRDPELSLQDNPGCISQSALAKVSELLRRALTDTPEEIERWFGRFITDSKLNLLAEPPPTPLGNAELHEILAADGRMQRFAATRFAYMKPDEQQLLLFVDGHEYRLDNIDAWLGKLLCRHRFWSMEQLRPALERAETTALLLELCNRGYLLPE